jgi:phosphoribosylformylglycinamidine (FGAM) synthase-like enzyme
VSDYVSHHGEAMAMGERTPLALLDAAASGRVIDTCAGKMTAAWPG